MSDYSHLTLANLEMNERIERVRRSRVSAPRDPRRHRIADRLHHLADRIDV